MEYGKIINRSASIVWQNKFLMVVGILAAIGSGFFGGSGWSKISINPLSPRVRDERSCPTSPAVTHPDRRR